MPPALRPPNETPAETDWPARKHRLQATRSALPSHSLNRASPEAILISVGVCALGAPAGLGRVRRVRKRGHASGAHTRAVPASLLLARHAVDGHCQPPPAMHILQAAVTGSDSLPGEDRRPSASRGGWRRNGVAGGGGRGGRCPLDRGRQPTRGRGGRRRLGRLLLLGSRHWRLRPSVPAGPVPAARCHTRRSGLWSTTRRVLDFAACSGATTADVLASQISALQPGTDLVTITIGGNDAGFGPVLQTCTTAESDGTCFAAVDAAEGFERTVLRGRLSRTYTAIRQAAPACPGGRAWLSTAVRSRADLR